MTLENIISGLNLVRFNPILKSLFYSGVMSLGLVACGNTNIPNTSTLPSGFCESETYNREGECIPVRPLDCGEGTYESNGECLPNNTTPGVDEAVPKLPLISFVGNLHGDGDRLNSGWEIYTIDLEGDNLQQLTNPSLLDSMLPDYAYLHSWIHSWSADGQNIVFESNRDGSTGDPFIDEEREIYSMRADGTHQQRLTNNRLGDGGAKYSPDGTKIVFRSWSVNTGGPLPITNVSLYVMNSDGSDRERLTDLCGTAIQFGWIPNTSDIFVNASSLFCSGEDTMRVLSLDGTERHLDTISSGVWSPNGDKIAYVSSDGSALSVADKYGHNQREVVNSDTTISNFQWLPDNRTLLFLTYGLDGEERNYSVLKVKDDWTNLETLSSGNISIPIDDVAFAPDGKNMAFVDESYEPRGLDLYVLNLETTELRLIMHSVVSEEYNGGGFGGELQWQPKP